MPGNELASFLHNGFTHGCKKSIADLFCWFASSTPSSHPSIRSKRRYRICFGCLCTSSSFTTEAIECIVYRPRRFCKALSRLLQLRLRSSILAEIAMSWSPELSSRPSSREREREREIYVSCHLQFWSKGDDHSIYCSPRLPCSFFFELIIP